jgi:hypothetical protein
LIDAVSDLLKLLPGNGVGSTVARDTWHPESGKFWVITKVQSKDKGVSERKKEIPERVVIQWA